MVPPTEPSHPADATGAGPRPGQGTRNSRHRTVEQATCLFSAGSLGGQGWDRSIWSPPGLKRPGSWGNRSLGLEPGCLPFGGCSYTEPGPTTSRGQGVLPFEDNCFPLGTAHNHSGSLCLFGQACLLELGFWPSLGYLAQGSEPQLPHL